MIIHLFHKNNSFTIEDYTSHFYKQKKIIGKNESINFALVIVELHAFLFVSLKFATLQKCDKVFFSFCIVVYQLCICYHTYNLNEINRETTFFTNSDAH